MGPILTAPEPTWGLGFKGLKKNEETETFDIVSLLAITLRMFDSSISVKSTPGGAAARFTADTGGWEGGDGVGLAGDSFGGSSTDCVTG